MIARACTAATYTEYNKAHEVKRTLARRLAVTVRHCEKCDKYHLRADAKRMQIPKKALSAIHYLALGYSVPEIAKMTGTCAATLRWNIAELKYAFNALSAVHLVAILISLGQLDPNEYVPELTERCQPNAGSSNHRRNALQRNRAPRVLQSVAEG